jgi:uncharacterized phiE125 gp8 family phage protein
VRLKLVTPPSGEPVTLDEAKAHLGVTDDASDALIKGLVTAARQACEAFSRRAFITQVFDLALDGVQGGSIELPRAPLVSVTSVTYYADDGTSGSFSDYYLDNFSEPGRIVLNRGASWPSGLRPANGLIVRFTAGYGARADVPQGIRRAILTTVTNSHAPSRRTHHRARRPPANQAR